MDIRCRVTRRSPGSQQPLTRSGDSLPAPLLHDEHMKELLLMPYSDGSFALPTGTVTFLLTDIEGSSTRWDTNPEAMAPAVNRHYEIIDDAVSRWGGVRPVEQGTIHTEHWDRILRTCPGINVVGGDESEKGATF